MDFSLPLRFSFMKDLFGPPSRVSRSAISDTTTLVIISESPLRFSIYIERFVILKGHDFGYEIVGWKRKIFWISLYDILY